MPVVIAPANARLIRPLLLLRPVAYLARRNTPRRHRRTTHVEARAVPLRLAIENKSRRQNQIAYDPGALNEKLIAILCQGATESAIRVIREGPTKIDPVLNKGRSP